MPDARADVVWMPLLVDKYLADTTALTTEQHGAYLLLLMAGWKRGGHLPDDDSQLAALARLSPARWRSCGAVLRGFFRTDGLGQLVQKRLTLEVERAQHITAVRSKAARSRSKPAANAPANGVQMGVQNGSKPPSKPAANHHANGGANDMQMGDTGGDPVSAFGSNGVHPYTNTFLASARNARAQVPAGVTAGEACKAMKAVGMARCNPSHPTLVAMLEQGITLPELVDAASAAVERGKGFQWALERAIGQRADAARVQLAPAVVDDSAARMAALEQECRDYAQAHPEDQLAQEYVRKLDDERKAVQ